MHASATPVQYLYSGDADSWYIRHCVTLGLTRVFQNCKHLPTQDGMSEIAWNTLQKRMSLETEAKVLEAHKLELVRTRITRL